MLLIDKLKPIFFNNEVQNEYIKSLKDMLPKSSPEIIIEAYFKYYQFSYCESSDRFKYSI